MLSAIFIKGFKTFARPVRMPLSGGITAVVGPNGSGKSNITDAIQFALGEGSPSVLRAGSMDDVVFSGSETLPAANAAEVTLVLDNSAGLLSLPYEEVSLTRRITRGGETEYRINGVRSRLADVRAIAGEAGLGRHSILRQGAVDAIVAGGATACRMALEESAGLGVFRRRRQSAGRRLERAAVQLENSRQLESELAEQLARIRTEAVAAREYRELESRYRSLSLAYLCGSATRDLGGLRERVAEAEKVSESLSAREVDLRAERGRLEAEERDAGHSVLAAEQSVERLEDCLERLRSQALRVERVLLRFESGRNRDTDRRRAIPRLEAELEQVSGRLARLSDELEKREGEHARARQVLAELESEVEGRRKMLADAASTRAKSAEVADGLRARRERVAGRLRDEKAVLGGREIEKLAEAGERMGSLLPRKSSERAAAIAEEVEVLRGMAARLGSEADRRSGTLSALVGRAEAEAHGLRATAGPGKRLYEVVRARRGYEAAVEAALGDLAGGVLAQTLGDGIRYLTEESSGERVAVRLDAERLPEDSRVGKPLVECVEVLDPGFEEAVMRLLGGVYVLDEPPVEGSAPTNGHVVVTRQGMRLTRTSASLRSGDGDFAREARLALWEVRLEELRSGIGEDLRGERDASRTALDRCGRLAAEVGAMRAGEARISRAVRLMCQEAERRARRSERARAARHEVQQELETLLTRISDSEEAERAALGEETWAREALSQVSRAVEPAYAASREAAGHVVRARDELAAARKRSGELRRRLERLKKSVPDDTAELSGLARRASGGSEILESVARERLAAARRARSEAAERRGAVSGRLGTLAGESAKAAVEAAQAHLRVEALSGELSRAEEMVDEAEIELFEEWGATLETARAEAEGMPAGTDVERERGRLARKLKKFGDVNLLAISQEGSLRERHDFVAAQRQDAEDAAAELEIMIQGIDEEITGRFERTFERVREAFEAMVPRMISGATGELTLSDEGVEIGLRLRRRGWRPLRVLSGGERALLALSFLFGIFLGQEDRGSGAFCVLDEAEAALDDINLARFLSVVDSYRASGQFLLVTHQKRTMAAADVLYGITPDATGASIVVSKRLTGD